MPQVIDQAADTTVAPVISPITLAAELIGVIRSEQLNAIGPHPTGQGEENARAHALHRLDVDPADPIALTFFHERISTESAPDVGVEKQARSRAALQFFEDEVVRGRWARSGEIPEAAAWFVPSLVEFVTRPGISDRRRVIDMIGLLGCRAGAAVPALAQIVHESEADDPTRHAAALALLRIGEFP